MSKPKTLNCPTCAKSIRWTEEYPHRPFCSQRCQQIDFGDWATESFAIAGEPVLDEALLEDAQLSKQLHDQQKNQH